MLVILSTLKKVLDNLRLCYWLNLASQSVGQTQRSPAGHESLFRVDCCLGTRIARNYWLLGFRISLLNLTSVLFLIFCMTVYCLETYELLIWLDEIFKIRIYLEHLKQNFSPTFCSSRFFETRQFNNFFLGLLVITDTLFLVLPFLQFARQTYLFYFLSVTSKYFSHRLIIDWAR